MEEECGEGKRHVLGHRDGFAVSVCVCVLREGERFRERGRERERGGREI